MSHDVFISYSTRDKLIADAVCAALESDGIRCWIAPRDVLPGSEWGATIVHAIEHCSAMVLVFSASANESVQVSREAELAVSKGKVIVPFRTENIRPSGSLELFLSTTHWLDAITPPIQTHLATLRTVLRRLMPEGRPSLAADTFAQRSSAAENRNPSLPAHFQVRVVEGPHTGEVFALCNTRMVIGRHPDCDIPLRLEAQISRQHCSIQWDQLQRGFVLVDFGASQFCAVNGEIVRERARLEVGDRISIGKSVMLLEELK